MLPFLVDGVVPEDGIVPDVGILELMGIGAVVLVELMVTEGPSCPSETISEGSSSTALLVLGFNAMDLDRVADRSLSTRAGVEDLEGGVRPIRSAGVKRLSSQVTAVHEDGKGSGSRCEPLAGGSTHF